MRQLQWVCLFHEFLTHDEPAKLLALLDPLEMSIIERMQELKHSDNGHAEKIAIRDAVNKILKIKTEKLGFPPILH
jgi:hypothetical protein